MKFPNHPQLCRLIPIAIQCNQYPYFPAVCNDYPTMSLLQKSTENSFFQQKCDRLLKENEIRFAGLINGMGRLVVGNFKEGIIPLEDNAEMQKMYMELALRVSMRKEFDYSLGPVEYCASRRGKVVMISVPIGNNVLLVSAETHVDIDKLGKKILKIIE